VRIVPKLTLALTAASAVVVCTRATLRIERHAAAYELAMEHNHRVVGHVLAASMAEVARREGATNAEHLIDVVNETKTGLALSWDRDRVSTGDVQGIEGPELVSLMPVAKDDPRLGSLRIREPLTARDEEVRSERTHVVYNLLGILAAGAVTTLILSRVLVGRPVELLVQRARRIANGELTGRLDIRSSDELGELATEMNLMCEALTEANARVLREAEARVEALEQLRHADRLATVGKLAAGLAHELGTPLAVVAGRAQMIASHEVEGEAVVDSAKTIEREAWRMTAIVRQLLDFARQKRTLGESSDATESANRAIGLFRPMAEKQGVELALEAPADVRVPMGTESVQQVLSNLLANAMHAMPSGGRVVIRINEVRAEPPAELGEKTGPYLRLDVADTGTGIAPTDVPHVFEPFFTTKEPGDGTGLGLSVVYGLVREHHGWVSVDNRPGRGVTFSVFLPKEARS